MKPWQLFVLMTVVCWGAYVPVLHQGQAALGKNSALRAFLFVGAAYGLVSAGVLFYLLTSRREPMEFTSLGGIVSTLAGVLGALGALGIVFALKNGGSPLWVVPLVFGGAPIVGTFITMIWHRPAESPQPMFYIGLVLACAGAALVLRFKPA